MIHVLEHFFQYFYYGQPGEPWYHANVWGNVFVIAIVLPLGWVWAKTKYWPLRPMREGFAKMHEHFERIHAHHQRQHEHNEWMAQTQAAIHREATGKEPPDHPHFDVHK